MNMKEKKSDNIVKVKKPLLQKISESIKEKKTFKEIIINSEPLERRVAFLIDGILEKFEVERLGDNRIFGAIFKGKIQNHEPGLKAVFINIGQSKNAFLHYWDIIPQLIEENNNESVKLVYEENKYNFQNKNINIDDVIKKFPNGKEIIVQVTKAHIGNKGPRVTTNITLLGRFIILMPYTKQFGISKKIELIKERDRIKKIIKKLNIPNEMGIIVRTAAQGKKIQFFIKDLQVLLKKWEKIQNKINNTSEPSMIEEESSIIELTIRDFLNEDIQRIIIDKKEDYNNILGLIDLIDPKSKNKVFIYENNIPIFERYNIEPQIKKMFMKKVNLPSGGEIILEETEALTAIDVNTCSHKWDKEEGIDYILQANIEAAFEISRQIRLRNIGGLIILDFIDMKSSQDRNKIYNCMIKEIKKDKAKCNILPISKFGIMQMTRQRHVGSMFSSLYSNCHYCKGKGKIKSYKSISVEIHRKITSILSKIRNNKNFNDVIKINIYLHPDIIKQFKIDYNNILKNIENKYNAIISLYNDISLHLEHFKIIDSEEKEW